MAGHARQREVDEDGRAQIGRFNEQERQRRRSQLIRRLRRLPRPLGASVVLVANPPYCGLL